MSDTTTTEPVPVETESDEMPAWARRAIRLSAIGIVIALLGVVLGGASVWGWARQVGRESAATRREAAQTAWDQQQGEHDRCVAAAESRAVTIETGHAQYDSDFRQIAGRLDTIVLLESIAALFPPSPVIDEALVKMQQARERIQMDGFQTAAELVAFDEKRPPLDPAACPAPPTIPRP